MVKSLPPYLQRRYADVVVGIKEGFRLGLPPGFKLEKSVIVEPKERYDAKTRDAILEYLDEERAAGRVIGPLAKKRLEEILGVPFQTSPFKLVPKAGSSKMRFVRDLSAPHGADTRPSANDFIAQGAALLPPYRTHWHTFPQIATIVLSLPPHARAHVADIKSAFRIIPVHPDERCITAMNLDDHFYLDLALPMGLSCATDVFGSIMDAYRHGAEQDWHDADCRVVNWVDDLVHFFSRPLSSPRLDEPCAMSRSDPNGLRLERERGQTQDGSKSAWSATNEAVDRRLKHLGMPAAPEKVNPIKDDDPTFDFLGFRFDIENKTVALLEKKRLKFLARLEQLDTAALHLSLDEIEVVVGSLVHLAYVLREGKFRLRALFSFSASFNGKRGIRRHPSSSAHRPRDGVPFSGVVGELHWWKEQLEQGEIKRPLVARLADLDLEILSDACDTGIGTLVNRNYTFWPLRPGWKGESGKNIDFGEALGVELALAAAVAICGAEALVGRNVVAFCDNMGVVEGWHARSHANPEVARIMLRLVEFEKRASCTLELLYIASEENDADAISRGDFSGAETERIVDLTAAWTGAREDVETIAAI